MKHSKKPKKNFFPKNKKALSEIVITLMIILLVVVLSAVVYTMTKKTVQEKIKKTESCNFELIGKISINSEYTCYNSNDGSFRFSINVGDIELEELLVSIANETDSIKQFTLINESNSDIDLKGYSGGNTILPEKKSGKTYIAENIDSKPTQIQIAPKINGEQCDIVDSLNEISNC